MKIQELAIVWLSTSGITIDKRINAKYLHGPVAKVTKIHSIHTKIVQRHAQVSQCLGIVEIRDSIIMDDGADNSTVTNNVYLIIIYHI